MLLVLSPQSSLLFLGLRNEKWKEAMNITPGQITMIHVAKTQLKLSNDVYRDILWEQFQVNSSKALNYRQAVEMLRHLKVLGFNPKGNARRNGETEKQGGGEKSGQDARAPRKYDELGHRAGMASPQQLRMIEAMWADLCDKPDEMERTILLDKFLMNQYRVSHIKFLSFGNAGKAIEALKAIQASRQKKEAKKI